MCAEEGEKKAKVFVHLWLWPFCGNRSGAALALVVVRLRVERRKHSMKKLRRAGAALFVALFLALAFCVTGAFAQSAQVSIASQSVVTQSAAVVHTQTAVRPFGAFRVRSARVFGFRRFGAFRHFGAFRVNTFRAARFGLRTRFFRAASF